MPQYKLCDIPSDDIRRPLHVWGKIELTLFMTPPHFARQCVLGTVNILTSAIDRGIRRQNTSVHVGQILMAMMRAHVSTESIYAEDRVIVDLDKRVARLFVRRKVLQHSVGLLGQIFESFAAIEDDEAQIGSRCDPLWYVVMLRVYVHTQHIYNVFQKNEEE